MSEPLHSLRAELDTSAAVIREHERMSQDFMTIVDSLMDACVATLSMLALGSIDVRGIAFAADATGAIERALRALESATDAQGRIIVAHAERLREVGLTLEDVRE